MSLNRRVIRVGQLSRCLGFCVVVLLLLGGCAESRRARPVAPRRVAASTHAHAPVCPGKGRLLIAESFVSARVGYVMSVSDNARCPAQLLRTLNGGVSFSTVGPLPGNVAVFSSARTGWSYFGGLSHTRDGGRTWQRVRGAGNVIALATRGAEVLAVASRCGPNTCRHSLEVSSDGGATWSRRPLAVSTSAQWDRAEVLLTGGSRGVVLVGSKLWEVSIAPPRLARGVAPRYCQNPEGSFVAPWLSGTGLGDLWLLCALEPGAGSQGKLLFHSTDGGRSWTQSPGHDEFFALKTPVPDGGYVDGFSAPDRAHQFIALDRGTLIQSADAGRHWRAAPLPPSPDADLGDTGPSASSSSIPSTAGRSPSTAPSTGPPTAAGAGA